MVVDPTPVPVPAPVGPGAVPAIVSWLAARRKTIAALVTPWLLLASVYLGGVTVSHVWYALVIGELTALGVYAVPNG